MWAKQRGFTIVELLIVIIVIGILAAIIIVAFNGVQGGAQGSALQTDLSNAKKVMQIYQVNNDKYPTSTTMLGAVGLQASKASYDTSASNFFYCYNTITQVYAISARISASSKTGYVVTSTNSVQKVASTDGDQACQAAGLMNSSDIQGFFAQGYSTGSGWASWVK